VPRVLPTLTMLAALVAPAAALEVVDVHVPRVVRLKDRRPVRTVRAKVTIRNDTGQRITFADAGALTAAGLVVAAKEGSIVCPEIRPVLESPRRFPWVIAAGRTRRIVHRLSIPCGPNPAKETDWVVTAGSKSAVIDVVDKRASTAFALPGRYAVGMTTLSLVDASRPTMPNGTYPGAPDRQLPTLVWYPADANGPDVPVAVDGKPFPLVVFGHSLSGTSNQSTQYTTHLASHGYVVAAPAFPLSTLGAPGGSTVADTPAQAKDVSFVIDTFLGFSADGTNRFSGAIDVDRVAVTGHSGGAITTLVVTYDSGVRDPRIKAAIPLAPPSCWFKDGWFGDVTVPLLILQGDADLLVDVDANARPLYGIANPPKSLVRIARGNHMGFADFGSQIDDLDVCAIFPDSTSLSAGIEAMIAALGGAADHLSFAGCTLASCAGDPSHLDGRRQMQITKQTATAFLASVFRGDAVAERYLYEELTAANPELTHDFAR
jgi:predicted dienelactone hydrolase